MPFEWMTSIFWNKYKALIAGAVVKKYEIRTYGSQFWRKLDGPFNTGNMVTSGGESPP